MTERERLENAVKELHEKVAQMEVESFGEHYLPDFNKEDLVGSLNNISQEIDDII